MPVLEVSYATLGSPMDMPRPNNLFAGKAYTHPASPMERVLSDSVKAAEVKTRKDWKIFSLEDRAKLLRDLLMEYADPPQGCADRRPYATKQS